MIFKCILIAFTALLFYWLLFIEEVFGIRGFPTHTMKKVDNKIRWVCFFLFIAAVYFGIESKVIIALILGVGANLLLILKA